MTDNLRKLWQWYRHPKIRDSCRGQDLYMEVIAIRICVPLITVAYLISFTLQASHIICGVGISVEGGFVVNIAISLFAMCTIVVPGFIFSVCNMASKWSG